MVERFCQLPKQFHFRTKLLSILTSHCWAIDCWNFFNSSVAISLLFTTSDFRMLYDIILFCLNCQSFSWFFNIKDSREFLLAGSESTVWFSSDSQGGDCWLKSYFSLETIISSNLSSSFLRVTFLTSVLFMTFFKEPKIDVLSSAICFILF